MCTCQNSKQVYFLLRIQLTCSMYKNKQNCITCTVFKSHLNLYAVKLSGSQSYNNVPILFPLFHYIIDLPEDLISHDETTFQRILTGDRLMKMNWKSYYKTEI